MTEKLIAFRIHVQKSIEARISDAGQGSLEYIGAILVAAVVVGVVASAAKGINLGTAFSDAVKKITDAGNK
jgi:hypothetical protein